jgi:hypothetical protein
LKGTHPQSISFDPQNPEIAYVVHSETTYGRPLMAVRHGATSERMLFPVHMSCRSQLVL